MHATLHHNGQSLQVSSPDWLAQIDILGARGVIFDCDGTLVESEQAHFLALQAAVRHQGFELDATWYRARNGLDRLTLFRQFARELAQTLDVEVARAFSIAQFQAHVDAVSPIEATTQLLRKLSDRGFGVAVVTNAERPVATLSLQHIGLLEYLQEVVCISDGFPAKPAPHMFEHAAKLLGLAPYQAVVFEDSPQGVEAALSAGMAVFEVSTST